MFGKKCEVFDSPSPSNDTGTDRTTPAIFLGATGNISGTCRFLSLTTGELLDRGRFERTRLSSLDIARVEELAMADAQPKNFNFCWRDMSPIEDEDEPANGLDLTGA